MHARTGVCKFGTQCHKRACFNVPLRTCCTCKTIAEIIDAVFARVCTVKLSHNGNYMVFNHGIYMIMNRNDVIETCGISSDNDNLENV